MLQSGSFNKGFWGLVQAILVLVLVASLLEVVTADRKTSLRAAAMIRMDFYISNLLSRHKNKAQHLPLLFMPKTKHKLSRVFQTMA